MKKANTIFIGTLLLASTIITPIINSIHHASVVPETTCYFDYIKIGESVEKEELKNIKEKIWHGACVRSFSEIIEVKQWYVEPHMEYMFSGWLVAYDRLRGNNG